MTDGDESRWSARAGEISPQPNEDTESRARELSVEESRLVLDRQIDLLSEIDDKAMRTVRSSVLILGIAVSALSIGGSELVDQLVAPAVENRMFPSFPIPPHAAFVVGYATLSGLSLSFSIFIGTGIYTVSHVPLGMPDGERIRPFKEAISGAKWEQEIVSSHTNWIQHDLDPEIHNNSSWLSVVQLLLLFGISTLVASASELLLFSINAAPVWALLLPGVIIGMCVAWLIGAGVYRATWK